MSYYSTPAAQTQTLFDSELLMPQVANYYDWGDLYANASFISVINNLGNIEPMENTEVIINDETDLRNYFQGASGQNVIIPALNAESAAFIDLNTFTGLTGINGLYQVGDSFLIKGQISAATGTRLTTEIITAKVRVSDVNAVGAVKFTTLYITPKAASYEAGTVGYSGSNRRCEFLLTKVDEYGGDAPNVEKIYPSQYYNYFQLFRSAYGEDFVGASAKTLFDNALENTGRMSLRRLWMMLDREILFSAWGRAAAATSYRESAAALADGGTAADYGTMKGIPGFLGTESLSATTACQYQVDTGTALDFWNLRTYADKFTTGNQMKLGITSPTFATKIARAAYNSGYQPTTGTIEFPRWNWQYQEYDLGNIKMRLIVDRNLEISSPVVYDSVNTRYAGDKNILFLIDSEYFKICYHKNKYLGVMAPGVYDVDTTNGAHQEKKECKAMASCVLTHKSAHGVYAITNT